MASRTRVVRLKARLLKCMQKLREGEGGDHRGKRLEDRAGSASVPDQLESGSMICITYTDLYCHEAMLDPDPLSAPGSGPGVKL